MSEKLESNILDELLKLTQNDCITWETDNLCKPFESETIIFYSQYNELYCELKPYFSFLSFSRKYLLEISYYGSCKVNYTFDHRKYPKIKQLAKTVLKQIELNKVKTKVKDSQKILDKLKVHNRL